MKMKKSLTILATFAAAISAQAADDSLVLDATISDSVSYENRLALGGSNATLLITSTGELSTPQGILIQGNNVTIDVAAGGKILTKSILMYQGGTMKIKFGDATSIMNEDGTKGTIFTNRRTNLTFDLSAVKNASAMTIGTVSTTPPFDGKIRARKRHIYCRNQAKLRLERHCARLGKTAYRNRQFRKQ